MERDTVLSETNLFGESAPTTTPQGKCAHLNAEYTIITHGSVKLESQYEAGRDRVVEIERKQSYAGTLTGRCKDCKKPFYYTSSNLPKFIKRRLKMANIGSIHGQEVI